MVVVMLCGLVIRNLLPIAFFFWLFDFFKRSRDKRMNKEMTEEKKSLDETIKMYRIQNNMTQEFLAETLGVSRQAVSKWGKGLADPSTSNLLALTKVFNISATDLLKNME